MAQASAATQVKLSTISCTLTVLFDLEELKRRGALVHVDVMARLRNCLQHISLADATSDEPKGKVTLQFRQPAVQVAISERPTKPGFRVYIGSAEHEGQVYTILCKLSSLIQQALSLKADPEGTDAWLYPKFEELQNRQNSLETIALHELPHIYHHNAMLSALKPQKIPFLKLTVVQVPPEGTDRSREQGLTWEQTNALYTRLRPDRLDPVFDSAYKDRCLLKTVFRSIIKSDWYRKVQVLPDELDKDRLADQPMLDEEIEVDKFGLGKLKSDYYSTLRRTYNRLQFAKVVEDEAEYGSTEQVDLSKIRRTAEDVLKDTMRDFINAYAPFDQLADIAKHYKARRTNVPEGMFNRNGNEDEFKRVKQMMQSILPEDVAEIKKPDAPPDDVKVDLDIWRKAPDTITVSSLFNSNILGKRQLDVRLKLVAPRSPFVIMKLEESMVEYDSAKWTKLVNDINDTTLYVDGYIIMAYITKVDDSKLRVRNRLKLRGPAATPPEIVIRTTVPNQRLENTTPELPPGQSNRTNNDKPLEMEPPTRTNNDKRANFPRNPFEVKDLASYLWPPPSIRDKYQERMETQLANYETQVRRARAESKLLPPRPESLPYPPPFRHDYFDPSAAHNRGWTIRKAFEELSQRVRDIYVTGEGFPSRGEDVKWRDYLWKTLATWYIKYTPNLIANILITARSYPEQSYVDKRNVLLWSIYDQRLVDSGEPISQETMDAVVSSLQETSNWDVVNQESFVDNPKSWIEQATQSDIVMIRQLEFNITKDELKTYVPQLSTSELFGDEDEAEPNPVPDINPEKAILQDDKTKAEIKAEMEAEMEEAMEETMQTSTRFVVTTFGDDDDDGDDGEVEAEADDDGEVEAEADDDGEVEAAAVEEFDYLQDGDDRLDAQPAPGFRQDEPPNNLSEKRTRQAEEDALAAAKKRQYQRKNNSTIYGDEQDKAKDEAEAKADDQLIKKAADAAEKQQKDEKAKQVADDEKMAKAIQQKDDEKMAMAIQQKDDEEAAEREAAAREAAAREAAAREAAAREAAAREAAAREAAAREAAAREAAAREAAREANAPPLPMAQAPTDPPVKTESQDGDGAMMVVDQEQGSKREKSSKTLLTQNKKRRGDINNLTIRMMRIDPLENPLTLEKIWTSHTEKRLETQNRYLYRRLQEWLRDFVIEEAILRRSEKERYSRPKDYKTYTRDIFRNLSKLKDDIYEGWKMAINYNPFLLEHVPINERGNSGEYADLVMKALDRDADAIKWVDRNPFSNTDIKSEEDVYFGKFQDLLDAIRAETAEGTPPLFLDQDFMINGYKTLQKDRGFAPATARNSQAPRQNDGVQMQSNRALLDKYPGIITNPHFPLNLCMENEFAQNDKTSMQGGDRWDVKIRSMRTLVIVKVSESIERSIRINTKAPFGAEIKVDPFEFERKGNKIEVNNGLRVLKKITYKIKIGPRDWENCSYVWEPFLSYSYRNPMPADQSPPPPDEWWRLYALRSDKWLYRLYEFMQTTTSVWRADGFMRLDSARMNAIRDKYQKALIDDEIEPCWDPQKVKDGFEREDKFNVYRIKEALKAGARKVSKRAQLFEDSVEDEDEDKEEESVSVGTIYNRLPSDADQLVQNWNAAAMAPAIKAAVASADIESRHKGESPEERANSIRMAKLHAEEKFNSALLESEKENKRVEAEKIIILANHLIGRNLLYYRTSPTFETATEFADLANHGATDPDRLERLQNAIDNRRSRMYARQKSNGQPEVTIIVESGNLVKLKSKHPAARAHLDLIEPVVRDMLARLA
jgi:hypothetical protein